MIDGYGRNIDYIRISVTDRCNLRCAYCMPEKGVSFVPHEEILNYEEIVRLAQILSSAGFRKIKLTGGEPLVRKGISNLVRTLKEVPGIEQVTLTTNGVMLSGLMGELADAKIDGINLSLDTLNPSVYEQITKREYFDEVMKGFHTALKYPQIPLKINCVPMGIDGQNVVELAELAKKYPVHVRYIEMMPVGLGKEFDFCSEDVLLRALAESYGEYSICSEKLGNGPGHYYVFPDFLGKIGFISAISHKFCETCNRVRMTSQGYLKTCLQYDMGTDLKKLLRDGASDECIRETIIDTVMHKPAGHHFKEGISEHEEKRIMAQIGG